MFMGLCPSVLEVHRERDTGHDQAQHPRRDRVRAKALAAAGIVAISPEAKVWLAETIERLATLACSELCARALAQEAARATWERVYRCQRDAGNWSPAVRATNLPVNSDAAAHDPDAAALLLEER